MTIAADVLLADKNQAIPLEQVNAMLIVLSQNVDMHNLAESSGGGQKSFPTVQAQFIRSERISLEG